jgi:perosamine synthetase
VSDFIPYSTQWLDEDDIRAVTAALESGWITQGPAVSKFEAELAAYCGAKYAVAVANGTAGLHLACLAAGVGPGDKIVTSPITFVASANCALYVGAEPVLADIDESTHNLDPAELEKALAAGGVRVVIPVHFAGLPCDMEKIGELARKYDVTVIEDGCHALSAEYQTADGEWVKVGSCRHSDMAVFSFHPVKPMTTAEGGVVTTNSRELYERLVQLRTHGITKDKDKLINHDGPWYYEMQALGFNYRLTDIQCALGSSQLKKLDGWRARRAEIAARYDAAFKDRPDIKIVLADPSKKSAYHLYVIEVEERDRVFHYLRENGLVVQVHYIPVHYQPYYRDRFGYAGGEFPRSEAYYRRCISIPLYPKMTDDDVDRVIATVIRGVGA